jgi:hypothetical protein
MAGICGMVGVLDRSPEPDRIMWRMLAAHARDCSNIRVPDSKWIRPRCRII